MYFDDPYENDPRINNIYVIENIPTSETKIVFEEVFAEGCTCSRICTLQNNCLCLKKYGENYNILINKNESCEGDAKKLNYSLVTSKYNSAIYECNDSCKCVGNFCGNRYVQFGPRTNLFIKDCQLKGKGLFTAEKIVKGSFICEYAGEVITKTEAMKRFTFNEENNLMNYILCVKEHFGTVTHITFIDPTNMGNIGRFANHSCKPNCEIISVRVNNIIPKLCLFTKYDIEKNNEITFSYGESLSELHMTKVNRTPCLCGEEDCAKWLPYFPEMCK